MLPIFTCKMFIFLRNTTYTRVTDSNKNRTLSQRKIRNRSSEAGNSRSPLKKPLPLSIKRKGGETRAGLRTKRPAIMQPRAGERKKVESRPRGGAERWYNDWWEPIFCFQSSEGDGSTSTTGSRSSAPSCPRPTTRKCYSIFHSLLSLSLSLCWSEFFFLGELAFALLLPFRARARVVMIFLWRAYFFFLRCKWIAGWTRKKEKFFMVRRGGGYS